MAERDINAVLRVMDENENINRVFPATKIENVDGLQTVLNAKANSSDVTSGLAGKVDKETGKGLSTNDYTTEEKNKLSGIAEGATANVGTVTGVKMNGTTKNPTSGVVDLGTVITEHQSLSGYVQTSTKGAVNGVASLDENGKVPAAQLPSYVDDVLEYASKSAFPATGESGKIYIDKATEKTYRWSGTAYVEISESLALGETSSTAYPGDKGKTAYTHATDSSRLTTAKTSGLYKMATTAEGHVASATPVTKSDITELGIPAQDTTYSNATTSAAGLMSAADKTKLNGIEAQANKTVVDDALSSSSTNPVQNKVVTDALNNIVAGGNYLTPQMYGAKGDGETDDSTAFSNLRTAAISTGKAIYIPNGTYLINSIVLWDNAVIIGESTNGTILKQIANVSGTFIFSRWNSQQSAFEQNDNVIIKNLTLDGYDSTGTGSGLRYHGFQLYLEAVTIRGFNKYGMEVTKPDTGYAGKHGYMKDIMLYDNEQGNMLYEGETDNNFYNIMAYHNAGIEPAFNVKFNSSGCRVFGMHLWGLADISLWSNCFGATYTGCHIEGGKTAKIAIQQRCQFYGEIYHHDNNNTVTAIKALDSLYDCTLDFEARNIYKLFDLNNKWLANNHVRVNADMISDNLFANGRFGVADDVSINWGYNNSRYVYIMNVKNYVDTYNNVNSVFAEVNESYYKGTSKVFEVQAGSGQTDDYVSIYPNTGRCGITAKGNSNNVDLYLSAKGDGAVKFNHTCITGADYDDFVDAGFYEALGDTDHPTQNAPDGNNTSNNFLVLVQNRGNRVVQIASSVRTPVMYQRLIIAGVASDWERITTGAEYTVTPNEFNVWNGESYASIEQAPKDDIHVKLARDRYTIGNSGEDLNNCVDTTKLYYNWNGNGSDVNYPIHTPSEMVASPFFMTATFHRNTVLVQKLIADNAGVLGSTWYRRRTGAGTQEDPFVWEDWQPSGNTFPRHFANKIGANYNDIGYVGVHLVQGTPENNTQNAPDGNNTSNNYVVVNLNPRTGTTYFPQMAYSVRADQSIYHRCHAGSGGFGTWKKIADEDDIAAMPRVYMQSTQPTNLKAGDLWFQPVSNS